MLTIKPVKQENNKGMTVNDKQTRGEGEYELILKRSFCRVTTALPLCQCAKQCREHPRQSICEVSVLITGLQHQGSHIEHEKPVVCA